MPDIVDKKARSRMMAGIRASNTKPELLIRKELYARGFRYRLHPRHLPGKPDLLLKKHRAAIFVNGCFWHGHNCHLFKLPATRTNFWSGKIATNQARDHRVILALTEQEWRVLTIWECAVKGKTRWNFEELMTSVSRWIKSSAVRLEISGVA